MPFSIRPFQRFPVQQSLMALAVLMMLPAPSYAGPCIPLAVEKESPYRYILALIDSMGYAKTAMGRHKQEEGTKTETLFDFFYGRKLAKADFECAKLAVSPYISSANRAIKASAEIAEASFAILADLQGKAALDLKSILDAGPEKFKYGTALEQQAERAASIDEAWKLFFQAGLTATYTVIGQDPETKLMSRLVLTDNQRNKILQELHAVFGDEITKGMKVGQSSLVGAGAVLYQVIGDSRRRANGVNILE